jgi:hypothetical protein
MLMSLILPVLRNEGRSMYFCSSPIGINGEKLEVDRCTFVAPQFGIKGESFEK